MSCKLMNYELGVQAIKAFIREIRSLVGFLHSLANHKWESVKSQARPVYKSSP